MRKIANTTELHSELRSLLAYAQTERPSRTLLAKRLRKLSHQLTAKENLSEKELFAMSTLIKYKAFARAKYLRAHGIDYTPDDPTIQSLAAKGYLKVSKGGSITPNYNRIVRELPLHPRPSFVNEYDWPEMKELPGTDVLFPEGTIVVYTWGYEQTNVEFYEVTRVINDSTVELRELEKRVVEQDESGMQASVVPEPGRYTGMGARVRVHGDRLKMQHGNGRVWAGKPVLETSYH